MSKPEKNAIDAHQPGIHSGLSAFLIARKPDRGEKLGGKENRTV
jgi:hypothetical protein